MTRTTLLLLGLLASAPVALRAQALMNLDELIDRRGVYLHPRTLDPYSGPVESRWNAETVRERGTLRDGRWDGVHEQYYLNGQLEQRETYRNGVLDGPFESYFRMGMPSDKGTYREGLLEGAYEAYWSRQQGQSMHAGHAGHEDGMVMAGDLAEQGQWSSGKPCGEWYRFLPRSSRGLRTGETVQYPPCPPARR